MSEIDLYLLGEAKRHLYVLLLRADELTDDEVHLIYHLSKDPYIQSILKPERIHNEP